ncbi:hypothetical protein AALP_AAs64898U000100 [Arabis alpina]|uniref:Uncharacterized protein n=1 Tax=Arabis alpina TaxID=50452 RepID=A0A087G298_ARAAL|nr:hypothetical protein AALP_AAs64898U000100 [Arabis alpina]
MMILRLRYFEINRNRIHRGSHFEKNIHKFRRDKLKF